MKFIQSAFLFSLCCVANGDLIHSTGLVENLLVNKLIVQYLQIENDLWQVIERREENTLEQIYNEHKNQLKENQFQNYIDRIRIVVDLNLSNQLRFLNETTTKVYFILQSRDYGGLNRFAHSTQVQNISSVMESINQMASNDLWIDLKDDATNCKQHFTVNYPSEHQNMVEVYKDIQALMLRGYISVQLANMIQGLRDKEKYQNAAKRLRFWFNDYNRNFRESALKAIHSTNRDVLACSPDNYLIESTEYEMITGFLQGFIDNEINLDREPTCQRKCSDYKNTHQFSCHNDTLCGLSLKNTRLNRCKGFIRDCEFIESDVEICPSTMNMKRYKYLKYEDGPHFGDRSGCSNPLKAYSWTDWFVRCHNCFCLCDEDDPASDRYFSLRNVVSDIESNYIVTGIHIAKPNRIIELAISERKLLGYGKLKPTNNYFHFNYPTWKRSHPKLQLNDRDVHVGIDFHQLTYENRSINFDTVIIPQGHVVTGVRFGVYKGHLRIEVRATRFDFETGNLLNIENSTWHGNDDGGQYEIPLINPKPIGLHNRPIINIIPHTFARFSPSDLEADAAQTIVPFLETSKVEPIQPVPLSGVGLYYKGKKGQGGMIAPKLVVYDFESLI